MAAWSMAACANRHGGVCRSMRYSWQCSVLGPNIGASPLPTAPICVYKRNACSSSLTSFSANVFTDTQLQTACTGIVLDRISSFIFGKTRSTNGQRQALLQPPRRSTTTARVAKQGVVRRQPPRERTAPHSPASER